MEGIEKRREEGRRRSRRNGDGCELSRGEERRNGGGDKIRGEEEKRRRTCTRIVYCTSTVVCSSLL
jgi:hypothetical protein